MELTPTATNWAAMRFGDRQDALVERWHGFQRRTLADAWDIGRGLRAIKNEMQHGEWLPFVASIGMSASTAKRFMGLGEGYQIAQLGRFASVDDALKALPPKRPKEEPAPPPTSQPSGRLTCPTCDGVADETCMRCNGRGWLSSDEVGPPPDEPEAVTGDVMSEEESEAAMDEAASEAEAEADPEADRETREERLSIRLEGTTGDAVEALSGQLDTADARHRDDVSDVNKARKVAAGKDRRLRDVCNALLAATPSTALEVIDDVLARFFSVARK